jgi:hypothetical protein
MGFRTTSPSCNVQQSVGSEDFVGRSDAPFQGHPKHELNVTSEVIPDVEVLA